MIRFVPAAGRRDPSTQQPGRTDSGTDRTGPADQGRGSQGSRHKMAGDPGRQGGHCGNQHMPPIGKRLSKNRKEIGVAVPRVGVGRDNREQEHGRKECGVTDVSHRNHRLSRTYSTCEPDLGRDPMWLPTSSCRRPRVRRGLLPAMHASRSKPRRHRNRSR